MAKRAEKKPEEDQMASSDAAFDEIMVAGARDTIVAAHSRAHAAEHRPFGSAQGRPGSCINCGQVDRGIDVTDAGKFRCPQCRHEWTAEDEKAPFRRR